MPIASANPFPSMLYVEGTTPSSPSSGQQRLFVRSSDHVLCMVNSSGTVTALSGSLTNPMSHVGAVIIGGTAGAPTELVVGAAGRVLRSDGTNPAWAAPVPLAFVQRNANAAAGNDYAVGNGVWAVIDATNITVTLAALTGDVVGVVVNGQWDGNDYAWLTVASIVSGSPVNYIDNGTGTPGTSGVLGWMDQGDSDQPGGSQNITGEFLYTLQSGDISGGNVTLRLYGKENSGTVKKLLARTGYPLQFIVKNYGH